ncbi:ubiquitin-specific protease ubp1 [Umbelopsis sp. WA50703]
MTSSNYQLPAIAAVAGLAIAASSLALSSTSQTAEQRKRKRRIKAKLQREREGRFVMGLINSGNSCFLNSVLQALATLPSLRSYLAERVDDPGDEAVVVVPPQNRDYILASVAYALYQTIEALNKPLSKSKSLLPTDIVRALERTTNCTISRQQQDAHELFQIISSTLTSEEEKQYRETPTSLFDASAVRNMALEKNALPVSNSMLDSLETSSMSSVGTLGSMWSSFSVTTVGGHLRPRVRRPRNPFTGLAASKVSCLKCGYTAAIRHHTFDNISLTVPQLISCTLEDCFGLYTKVDTLTDFQCRRCAITDTISSLKNAIENSKKRNRETPNRNDSEKVFTNGTGNQILQMQRDIETLEQALKTNVEQQLPKIKLTPSKLPTRTTKQTMFANPPKALCLHLSRSVYHPSGHIQKNHCRVKFTEEIDLAPFTTNGFLNTVDPQSSLSTPQPSSSNNDNHQNGNNLGSSRRNFVYLRNMALGHRGLVGGTGLDVALGKKPSDTLRPSFSVPIAATRPVKYRLQAMIVHYGNHDSGHFVTFRRKKLPTGHRVMRPEETIEPEETKFWRVSDDSVDEVDLHTVLSSEAYMLFYEREE